MNIRWLRRAQSGAVARGVSGELSRALGLLLVYGVFLLVSMVALLGWLRWHVEPQREKMARLVATIEDAHVDLVNEETGLRAYLVTGQPEFLQPYKDAAPRVAAADALLPRLVATPAQTADLLANQTAEHRWIDLWATPALDPATSRALHSADGSVDNTAVTRLFAQGKQLFDDYRSTEATFIAAARARAEQLRRSEESWLARSVVIQGCIALVMLGLIADRRRRLMRAISQPVARLMSALDAVREGRAPEVLESGPAEFREISAGIDEMANALAAERSEVVRRQRDEQAHAARLGAVLAVAREISGSLNIRYVMAAVATNAVVISGAESARLWLTPEDPTAAASTSHSTR